MNINELEAVAAIELCGSFAAAAKHLDAPVSTLSKRVSRLEGELGFPLFERKTAAMSVSLTEQGAALMPRISALLSANAELKAAVSGALGKTEQTLVIGRPPLLGDMGDSSLIARFLAENPKTELVSVIRSHAELLRLLSENQVECAFFLMVGQAMTKRRMWEMFRTERYFFSVLRESSEIFVGVSEKDALAEKSSVSIDELRGHTFIFNKWQDGIGAPYGRGPAFFDYLGANRNDFNVIYEDFINPDYVYRLVSLGGCAVPQVFPDKYSVPGIRFLRLEGWREKVSVVFIARKGRSGALKRFTDFIAENALTLMPDGSLFDEQEKE